MRPLKLTLQNFGPYKNVTIDFKQFIHVPLFLISGKTGSGKTTIFDGICFALFGKTSGQERTATQMRSSFAAPNEKTMVKLEFTHQNKLYTIKREPAYDYINKHGGTSKHAAKNELTYHDTNDELMVLAKNTDIKNFIEGLLHLNVQQFTQIVLLPQQQFRKFLAANSDEREKVLRQVFGTQLFADWMKEINNNVKEQNQEVETEKTKLKTLMKSIDLSAEVKEPLKDVPQWINIVNQMIQRKTQNLNEQNKNLRSQEKDFEDLNKEYQHQSKLVELFKEKEDLKKSQQEYLHQKSHIEDLDKRLQDLEWAQNNQLLANELKNAQKELTKDNNIFEKSSIHLTELQNDQRQNQIEIKKMSSHVTEINKLREKVQDLNAKLPLFQKITSLQTKLQETQSQKEEINTDFIHLQAELQSDHQKITTLQETTNDLERLTQIQVALNDEQHQLNDEQRVLDELTKIEQRKSQLDSEIEKTRHQYKQQLQLVNTYKNKYEQLNNAFLEGMIAYYAQRLKPSDPCPLCGSTIHPHLAQFDSKLPKVSEQELKTMQENFNKGSKKLSQIKEKGKGLKQNQIELVNEEHQKLTALLEVMKLPMTIKMAELKDIIHSKEQKLTQQQTALNTQKRIILQNQEELTQLTQKVTYKQQLKDQLQNRLSEIDQQFTKLKTTLTTHQTELSSHFNSEEEVKMQLKKWSSQVKEFDDQNKILQQTALKLTAQVAATQAENEQLRQNILKLKEKVMNDSQKLQLILSEKQKTEDEFWQLLNNLAEIKDLQYEINDYHQKVHTVNTQLTLITHKIGGNVQPDLKQINHQLKITNEKKRHLQTMIGALKNELQTLKRNLENVKKVWNHYQTTQKEVEGLVELSQVVNGKTSGNRLGLERYVLREYFKEVLRVATQILEKLTEGRYAFVLQKKAQRHVTTQTGLEIDIYDDEIGETRSVHTLSGGESFIAALALALALGEIIQRQNGGAQIDTLFIDEGFGSLDEDALHIALETLRTLESQNRMIGIISHVKELHTEIPDQIDVISHDGESTIKYHH